MTPHLRRRFWIEAGLACVALFLLALTAVQRNWIEVVFGVDPDQGSGAVEWILVAASIAVLTSCFLLARREWARVRTEGA